MKKKFYQDLISVEYSTNGLMVGLKLPMDFSPDKACSPGSNKIMVVAILEQFPVRAFYHSLS